MKWKRSLYDDLSTISDTSIMQLSCSFPCFHKILKWHWYLFNYWFQLLCIVSFYLSSIIRSGLFFGFYLAFYWSLDRKHPFGILSNYVWLCPQHHCNLYLSLQSCSIYRFSSQHHVSLVGTILRTFFKVCQRPLGLSSFWDHLNNYLLSTEVNVNVFLPSY